MLKKILRNIKGVSETVVNKKFKFLPDIFS